VNDDFETAVNMLVNDKMDRRVAQALIESAKARGEDVVARAEEMVKARAEYKRKLEEVPS